MKRILIAALALLLAGEVHAEGLSGPSTGGGSGGTPGGTSGQTQYNNSGAFGGYTMSGDCSLVASTGVITCLDTNGVAFGTAATKNTGTSGATVPLLNGNNTDSGANTHSGSQTFTVNGATGAPVITANGTVYAGATPYWLIDPGSAAQPTWNSGGTILGIAEPSTFGGNVVDVYNSQFNHHYTWDAYGDLNVNNIAAGAGTFGGNVQANYYLSLRQSTIASATTIAPTNNIFHISGTTAIATITPLSGMSSTIGGCLTIIADNIWTTTTGGNIANIITAVVGTMYQACYDGTNWYIK